MSVCTICGSMIAAPYMDKHDQYHEKMLDFYTDLQTTFNELKQRIDRMIIGGA